MLSSNPRPVAAVVGNKRPAPVSTPFFHLAHVILKPTSCCCCGGQQTSCSCFNSFLPPRPCYPQTHVLLLLWWATNVLLLFQLLSSTSPMLSSNPRPVAAVVGNKR